MSTRLFTVLYFSVRSSRSRALHLKIKIPVTVKGGVSKRSHEKIGDCEQSKCLRDLPLVFELL